MDDQRPETDKQPKPQPSQSWGQQMMDWLVIGWPVLFFLGWATIITMFALAPFILMWAVCSQMTIQT